MSDHQVNQFRVRATLDFPTNEVLLRIGGLGDGRWLTITGLYDGRFGADLEAQPPDPAVEVDPVVTMPRALAEAIRDELIRELGAGPHAFVVPRGGTLLPEPPPHPDSVRLDRLLEAVAEGLKSGAL